MNEINLALGLKEDAAPKETLAAIAELRQQVTELKAKKRGIPAGVDAKEVERRMAGGLSKSDAITVAQVQAHSDAKAAETNKK